MIAKIGIDLSMNSTGLVLHIEDGEEIINKFVLIQSSLDKASSSVQVALYKRDMRKGNYSEMDLATINSAVALAKCIAIQIKKFQDLYGFETVEARMEGSVLSTGFKSKYAKVNDLTVFNSTTKRMLLTNPIVSKIAILAPSTLKKIATGKGNAKKAAIVEAFMLKFPDFDKIGKIDDIADAYFLASGQIKEDSYYVK